MKAATTIGLIGYITFGVVVAVWGQSWQSISDQRINGTVYSVLYDSISDALIIAGDFDSIGSNADLRSIGWWSDNQWTALESGLSSYQWPASVRDMAIYNGELYVGGFITHASGIVCNGIAKWTGTTWSAVGGGVTNSTGNPGQVYSLEVIGDELYACGRFLSAGGVNVNGFAKWNGTLWSEVHGFPFFDPEGDVITDCIIYDGRLFVVGDFNGGASNGMLGIAAWNGVNWIGVGAVGVGQASSLMVYNNKLVVAGVFTSEMNPIFPGYHVASWDGDNWDNLGGGLGFINCDVSEMLVHDGKLFAVGSFSTAGGITAVGIATWNDSVWCDFGTVSNGSIFAIEAFHNTVYLGGGFTELNGNEIYSAATLGVSPNEENCGTLAEVNDIDTKNAVVSIHPNPTTTTTTISWPVSHHGNWQLNLFDASGRQVAVPVSMKTEGNWVVDMSGLTSGIYFGQLLVGEEIRSFRVVRE